MLQAGISRTSSRCFRLLPCFHFPQRVISIRLVARINVCLVFAICLVVLRCSGWFSNPFRRFVGIFGCFALSFSFLLLMWCFRVWCHLTQAPAHQFTSILGLARYFFSITGEYRLWCFVIKWVATLRGEVCLVLHRVFVIVFNLFERNLDRIQGRMDEMTAFLKLTSRKQHAIFDSISIRFGCIFRNCELKLWPWFC